MNKKICFYIALILVLALVTGLNYAVIRMVSLIPGMTMSKLALIQAAVIVIPSAIYSYKKLL